MNKACKTIAAAALIALVPLSAEMAKQQITVTKCDMTKAMSNGEVKYIGGDLFLDDEGNQVQPCKHEGSIFFAIIGQYKDGKKIFDESKTKTIGALAEERKKQREEAKQAENKKEAKPAEEKKETPPNRYHMTYGNENLEIEDVEAFRQAARAAEMRAEAGVKLSQEISNKVYEALGLNRLPGELPVNDKNLITEEKKERVQTLYDKLTSEISDLQEKMGQTQIAGAADDMAKNNRIYLSKNNIINQYPTETIDGISFSMFEARMATLDFLQETKNIVYDLATGSNRTLDERLAALEYISEQNIDVCAGQYGNDALNKAKEMLAEPDKMQKTGLAEWGAASQSTQNLYLSAVSMANDKIRADEYDSLPDQLTKGQYQALSDIDKYKYAPEMKGNYINRGVYLKKPLEKVINKVRIKN